MKHSLPSYEDLKTLIHEAGLTIKDVANVLDIRVTTLGSKLNGFAPLDKSVADRIRQICNRQIARNKNRKRLPAEYNSEVGSTSALKPGLKYRFDERDFKNEAAQEG